MVILKATRLKTLGVFERTQEENGSLAKQVPKRSGRLRRIREEMPKKLRGTVVLFS
jgi:hypothetical protein